MKIVIAPDKFKGSLSAVQACDSIAAGIRRVLPGAELIQVPMADGGEGTVESLVEATGGEIWQTPVCGPLGESVWARYGILGREQASEARGEKTVVIEMAQAAGFSLVSADKRNPLETTTYGVGQLILAGWENGCRDFVIGVGGSATNDCGTGMAQALGVKFYDMQGNEITTPMNGRWMGEVDRIDCAGMHEAVRDGRFTVACDVTNPLLGPEGASHIYSPQKGASPDDTALLERNMERIIGLIEAAYGRGFRHIPGAGAAGGLACGLMAFAGAQLERGIEIVLRQVGFAEKIKGADLIITGEGKIDGSTIYGKTISGIAAEAQKYSVPVIAFAGRIGEDAEKVRTIGVQEILPICENTISESQAISDAETFLADAAAKFMRDNVKTY